MTTMWKARSKERPPSPGESIHLLSPDCCYDEMLQAMSAYQTVASHISMEAPRLQISAIGRLFRRFRSASVESDKAAAGTDEVEIRSRTFSSTDSGSQKDYHTGSSRHYPSGSAWVTSASHPSPFSPLALDAQGQPLTGSRQQTTTTGFLPGLSLQNTPLTSGSSPSSAQPGVKSSDAGSSKAAVSGSSSITAQELRDSVLSALNDTSTSPTKSAGEKRMSRKQPKGTFKYSVQEGDTLVRIGAHFDVTPSELMKTNKLVSRTVFVGQILFIPDQNYVHSDPPTPTKSASPVPDTRPKIDIPLSTLPSIPGHAVQVTSPTSQSKPTTDHHPPPPRQKSQQGEDESDKECLQKFLKMPVRRVIEEEELEGAADSEGFTVKGMLLVTPNAIMFDPSVSDPIVIEKDGQQKYSVVVYMEEIKGVALFHDISPRMFWRQPKELRTDSPKPEAYRSSKGARPKVEGHNDEEAAQAEPGPSLEGLASSRLTPDGANSVGAERGQKQRASPDGGDAGDSREDAVTGRTSEELENMTAIPEHITDLVTQPGRASEEVEHALTSGQGYITMSPVVKQMSRSSEMDVCEIALLQDAGDVFGETRDFGPHMGRSSSEVHSHTSSALGRVSDASPGDLGGHAFSTERSDSTSDSVSTPTQGFAPVHFTDRSPKSVTTHPKPVPGKRVMVLPQSPVTSTDLKSEENSIAEVTEVCSSDGVQSGQFDISTATDNQLLQDGSDGWTSFTSAHTHPAPGEPKAHDFGNKHHPPPDSNNKVTGVPPPQVGDSQVPAGDHPAKPEGEGSVQADSESSGTSVEKLASQASDLALGDRGDGSGDESSKARDSSPKSSFSPLRTPAQHISSFFNYTSSFFRNASDKDKPSPPASPATLGSDGKGKYSTVLSDPPIKLHIKSEFTKADIARALGPDPKGFLPRSDSAHFEESPLYLQIRPGIQKNVEILQPRAFDHRNISPLLGEYWFVVPREMGDKLYSFLMEWQPDAYGDEEETKPREKFFYDVRAVENEAQQLKHGQKAPASKATFDFFKPSSLQTSDEHFNEMEKTWEILSKEEVYRAEKEHFVQNEEIIDESSFPELIGPTVIIKDEHVKALMLSLPRNMSVGYNWELVYATHKHGYSLQNLYMKSENMESDSPVLLFIVDTFGSVFGAYLSSNIRPNDTFYGSGATFLFTFYPTFRKFAWQGSNQFFMHGTKDFFAVGSGEGQFGLWLDGALDKGRSHSCTTFDNDVLAKEEDFSILQLEVWRFVDSSLL